jgi:hypothetical protein
MPHLSPATDPASLLRDTPQSRFQQAQGGQVTQAPQGMQMMPMSMLPGGQQWTGVGMSTTNQSEVVSGTHTNGGAIDIHSPYRARQPDSTVQMSSSSARQVWAACPFRFATRKNSPHDHSQLHTNCTALSLI